VLAAHARRAKNKIARLRVCAALRPPVVPRKFGAAFGGRITASFARASPPLRTRRGIAAGRLLLAGAPCPPRSARHSAIARRARRKCILPSGIRGRKATPRRSRAAQMPRPHRRALPRRAAQPQATEKPWPASRPTQKPTQPRPPCLGGGGRRNKTTAGHRNTRPRDPVK